MQISALKSGSMTGTMKKKLEKYGGIIALNNKKMDTSPDCTVMKDGVKNMARSEVTSKHTNMADNAGKNANLYPKNYIGEIMVLVDTTKTSNNGNQRMKNGLYLYEKIKDINCEHIKYIKQIGFTLFKIFFNDVISANNFVCNEEIAKRGMRAFIPVNFIGSYGVIRNVPLHLGDDFIMKEIRSDIKVTSVRRFLRKKPDSEGDLEPTFSVKLGFEGNEVPREVVLNYTKLKVDIYYPNVRQCYNCGRLGHTSKGCRSGKRCIRCGKADEECDGKCRGGKCILCGVDGHHAFDRKKCEKWEKEVELTKK